MSTKYQLLVKKGPQRGHVHPLNAILITLGRDPLADIVISDPEVSRQHARLMETEDGYELQDLGSTNGTFVSGQRLGGEVVLLQPGQQIEMGSGVTLLYQLVPTGTPESQTAARPQEEMAIQEMGIRETVVQEEVETAVSPPDPSPAEPQLPSWASELKQPPNKPAHAGRHIATAPLAGSPPLPKTPTPPPPSTANTSSRRRTLLIGLATITIMLGCCCAFTLFMWYIGGDWLLTQLGILP